MRQADIVFAGVDEAAIVAGTADPLEAALALEALGPRQVLIKLGAAGCLARIDGLTHEVPAPVVAVLDTVGAGDAFAAGYLAELIAGAAPEQRLATAVAAGAWAVTVSGDWEGMPDRRALEPVRRERAGRPLTSCGDAGGKQAAGSREPVRRRRPGSPRSRGDSSTPSAR